MAGAGVAFFIILLIIEYGILEGIMYAFLSLFQRKPKTESEDTVVDDDVQEERRVVQGMSKEEIEGHNLVMRQVFKYYGKFLAVNQLSVAINQ